MPAVARIYIGAVIMLGVLAALYGLADWQLQDPVRFACYLGLATAASALKVRLPGVNGTMSVLFVFLLASVAQLGLSETIIISVVATVIQSYWRPRTRPQAVQVVFSIAVLIVASATAEFVYRLDAAPSAIQGMPLRLALMASAFFLVNTSLVAAVISLTEQRRLAQIWMEFYSWTFPYYLIGAAVVGALGFIDRTLDWQAWMLILPTVYAIYRSYHLYLDRLEYQRRRAEEERRHAEEVAQLLRQTMAANDALRRANEDLEQFAYAASHDLQEPLRMIAIYSELLERRHREILGADGRRLLDTITDGAMRINDLVKDLLSYTKVSSMDEAVPSVTDPAEVMEEVRHSLLERIAAAEATIETGRMTAVQVHRTHVLQLLQNLLSNSLKYRSPDRKTRIVVCCEPAREGMVELTVADNGIGIEPEYHERIFGVFKRLQPRSVPGTGIGLAICRKIVQNYGGAIWVESAAGEGSTFHLTLPAARTDEPAPAPGPAEVPVRSTGAPIRVADPLASALPRTI